ncbi:hypothetical protein GQR58_029182 [Nymphon striatum]|nr:hypothetical protein GQR58_029182 [Nymphon striatum]
MKYLTLGEAEKEVGVTKSTISRAIKDGRLSANRNKHGHFQIDPAELFRVYDPIGSQGAGEVEYDSAGNGGCNPERYTTQEAVQHHADENDMMPWLRERLDKTEEKLAQTEEELEQKEAAYLELREAYNRLPSPDDFEEKLAAERERLEQEKIDALALNQRQYDKVLEAEREQQARVLAEQKHQQAQQHEKWKAALAERQSEIKQARTEAESLRQNEREPVVALKRERNRIAALESRSFLARLLNKKPTMAG